MLENTLHSTFILCKLKLRLLGNSLKNWASAGKLIGAGAGILLTAVSVTSGSSGLIAGLRQLPYAELILDWLMAAIVVYGVFIVFTGDLLTGHTLSAGQMSHDFAFLSSLPISPLSLIVVKLFERLITDYLGILILFSGLLGINCRDGITFSGVLLSVLLYVQLSLLIGLGINLVLILLKRFFRTATINNFFSLLGYVSAFITIIPYLFIVNFPADSLTWVFENFELLNATVFKFMVPAKWLGICLISKSFCDEFFYFSAFWLLVMGTGTGLFYVAIRLNWLHFSHSTARRTSSRGNRWFKGFMQKEVTLITSDYNIAINAILMPISIIFVEIYFLKQFLNLSSQASLLNIIFGAVIYFCMFGPMNAIGSEGKAIAFLETMPLSPAEIMQRKFYFWLLVAETIFVTATALTFYFFNYNNSAIFNAMAVSAFFTAACVWASISISAIFAVYDSKMLQQRSTFAGKLAAMAVMLLAAPIKDFSWLNAYNAVIFFCIGLLLYMKGKICLFYRLDQEMQNSRLHKRLNLLLLFFSFSGASVAIQQLFFAVIPGYDTGLWTWILPILCLSPFLSIYYLSQRSPGSALVNTEVSGNEKAVCQSAWLAWRSCLLVIGFVCGISYFFSLRAPLTVAQLRENLGSFVSLGHAVITTLDMGGAASEIFLNKLSAIFVISFAAVIAWFATLLLCGTFLHCPAPQKRPLYRMIGVMSPALLVPASMIPSATLAGIGMLYISHNGRYDFQAATAMAAISVITTTWLLFF